MQEIAQAKSSALPMQELISLNEEEKDINRLFSSGSIDNEERARRVGQLKTEVGMVRFNTVVELVTCLKRAGFDDQEVERITAHEKDHLIKAQSLGLEGHYQIQFGRVGQPDETSEVFGIFPVARIIVPSNISEEERRRILIEIAKAPEKLSPGDISYLKEN